MSPGQINPPRERHFGDLYVDTPKGKKRALLSLKSLTHFIQTSRITSVDPNLFYQCYLLACTLLRSFFGHPWLEEHIIGSGAPAFLNTDNADFSMPHPQAVRVVRMAEMLFNLQKIAGFDE